MICDLRGLRVFSRYPFLGNLRFERFLLAPFPLLDLEILLRFSSNFFKPVTLFAGEVVALEQFLARTGVMLRRLLHCCRDHFRHRKPRRIEHAFAEELQTGNCCVLRTKRLMAHFIECLRKVEVAFVFIIAHYLPQTRN